MAKDMISILADRTRIDVGSGSFKPSRSAPTAL
jgi:hypothetical protein